MRKLSLLIILFLAMLLMGCPDGSDTTAEIVGTWLQSCIATGSGNYRMDIWNFTETDFTWTQARYTDSVCTLVDGGDPDNGVVVNGTYTLGSDITTSDTSVTAQKIDFLIPLAATEYQIIRITGDTFLLGDTTGPTDPGDNNRPTTLETNPYIRQ
jgi:hypothetical protein